MMRPLGLSISVLAVTISCQKDGSFTPRQTQPLLAPVASTEIPKPEIHVQVDEQLFNSRGYTEAQRNELVEELTKLHRSSFETLRQFSRGSFFRSTIDGAEGPAYLWRQNPLPESWDKLQHWWMVYDGDPRSVNGYPDRWVLIERPCSQCESTIIPRGSEDFPPIELADGSIASWLPVPLHAVPPSIFHTLYNSQGRSVLEGWGKDNVQLTDNSQHTRKFVGATTLPIKYTSLSSYTRPYCSVEISHETTWDFSYDHAQIEIHVIGPGEVSCCNWSYTFDQPGPRCVTSDRPNL